MGVWKLYSFASWHPPIPFYLLLLPFPDIRSSNFAFLRSISNSRAGSFGSLPFDPLRYNIVSPNCFDVISFLLVEPAAHTAREISLRERVDIFTSTFKKGKEMTFNENLHGQGYVSNRLSSWFTDVG